MSASEKKDAESVSIDILTNYRKKRKNRKEVKAMCYNTKEIMGTRDDEMEASLFISQNNGKVAICSSEDAGDEVIFTKEQAEELVSTLTDFINS